MSATRKSFPRIFTLNILVPRYSCNGNGTSNMISDCDRRNDENSKVINFNKIDGEEYEEVGGNNTWE